MWEFVYIISFILLLGFLVLLYVLPSRAMKNFATGGFVLTVITYAVSLIFEPGGWLYKLLLVLPRDLAVFTILLFLVNKFAPRPKWLYFLLALVVVAFKFYYFDKLENTFDFEDRGEHPELIVDLKSKVTADMLSPILASYQLDLKPAFQNIAKPELTRLDEYYVINIPEQYQWFENRIVKKLLSSGLVDWVEYNEQLSSHPQPSEPFSDPTSAYTSDPLVDQQWYLANTHADDLFAYVSNASVNASRTAVIAILDSGVDSEHEDLKDRVISPSTDVVGHGTHCAGLAAAISNNAKGIASLVPSSNWVSILPVKVMNDFGTGTEQTVIQGMIEAVDSGADVLSMSLGGRSRDTYQRAFEDAVQYANAQGAIVVAAAGNNSEDASRHVPANIKGVITVSAIDASGELASFSNNVSRLEMGVAAPGVNILSTFPNDAYQRLQGTSMATPQVAGLIGMMKAFKPEITTRDAYLMILKYGSATGDLEATGVLINAENVMKNLIENTSPL